MYTVPSLPAPGVFADTDAFLASPSGQGWLGQLADNFPHTRYWRDRSDCWSLRSLNALAARIIDAHYDGHDVEEAMEAEYPPAEFWPTWHHEVDSEVRTLLLDAGGRDDGHEILDAIRSGWEDMAAERDDSCVGDLFASYDRCELLFRFSPHRWLDDSLLHSHRPWPEFAELAVTENLQFVLGNLGYTIGQYRKASGNSHKAYTALPSLARRRPAPIVSWEQVEELVDNACSTSFLVCLYPKISDGHRLRLRDSKTGPRTVWLGEEAIDLLASYPRVPKVSWIFWNQRLRKPFANVQSAWEQVRDAAGLRDFRLHDLRHTFASHAAMSRESLPMIGKLLGHSCMKSTARYAHLDDAHLLDAAEAIGSAIESAISSGR